MLKELCKLVNDICSVRRSTTLVFIVWVIHSRRIPIELKITESIKFGLNRRKSERKNDEVDANRLYMVRPKGIDKCLHS